MRVLVHAHLNVRVHVGWYIFSMYAYKPVCMCADIYNHMYIYVYTCDPTTNRCSSNHTLQNTATHCNTLQLIHMFTCVHVRVKETERCSPNFTRHHTATHCNTLELIHMNICVNVRVKDQTVLIRSHCNALQHTATQSCVYMYTCVSERQNSVR